ncbi:MAG: AAA family ATPase [Gemmatimonadetes bacterium]|nr:AAA family ATPase [Gemmatimonadota bacterium]
MNPPRVPPHDDAAERALLGALLLDARLPDQVLPQLGDADFYRPAHRRIAAAMATLVADGVPVELLGLCDVLRRHGELEACGGQEYLAMLLDDAVTSANIAAPLRLVQEHAARRALLDRMHHASEAVQSGELSAEALRTTLVSDLLGMSPDRSRAGFRPLPVHAVCDEIERRGRGEGSGLRLGWPEFDRQAQGLQAGEVVLICGAPKVGKSTVAAQCGMHVALSGQGGVGYVSAEMSSEAITERLLAALAGVPIGAMRAGTLTDAQYRRLAEASTALFRAPFWIDDGAVPRLQDIVARVLALKAQHPTLALVVVDFLQLVRYQLKGRRGDEELEAISYGLKDLAKRAQVVLVAPTQLNQKSIEDRPDKRPMLRDISGSSGPLKAADFVALLYRPALYGELPAGTPDHMLVSVAAARRTATFDVVLHWQATVMRGIPHDSWIRPDDPLPCGPPTCATVSEPAHP